MPRQGGQGKGKPKLKDRNFGRALIKRQQQQHQTIDAVRSNKPSQASILDNSALDDFIAMAEMEGEDFEVKRITNPAELIIPTAPTRNQTMTTDSFQQLQLVIPRKPAWNYSMTADEVDKNERTSFLKWRRDIALMESASNYTQKITPFEKNLEVWRQLWRVCDRSDLVIQVVDARNPLMFFTSDLKNYLLELNPPRPMLLLVNKADLLTDKQRKHWAAYFQNKGILFLFYSAVDSQMNIDSNIVPNRKLSESDVSSKFSLFLENWVQVSAKAIETAQKKAAKKAAALKKKAASMIRNGGSESGGDEDSVEERERSEEENELEKEESDADGEAEGEDEDIDDEDNEDDEDSDTEDGLYEVNDDNAKGGISSDGVSDSGEDDDSRNFTREESINAGNVEGWEVLSREDLISILTFLATKLRIEKSVNPNPRKISSDNSRDHRACIGMIGFPNVGKSSVINTLLGVSRANHGKVRVAVSSTPGKTKHFQTLILSDYITLCDCPGLVFPSFMRSAGEMLCSGILPINQMRDYVEAANLIATRIPQRLLEAAYGIVIKRELDVLDQPDRPPTASEMLGAYCKVKGYITGQSGRWDEFRASKDVLKDFTDGRLLYVAMPPNMGVADSSMWLEQTSLTLMRRKKIADRLSQRQATAIEKAGNYAWSGDDDNDDDDNEGEEEEGDDQHLSKALEETDLNAGDEDQSVMAETIIESGGIEYEYIAEEPTNEEDSARNTEESSSDTNGRVKREHKRLKTWGKKGRKLRDKDPYREDLGPSTYSAFFTNRNYKSTTKLYKGPI